MQKLPLILNRLAQLWAGLTEPFNNDPAVSLQKILDNYYGTTAHPGLLKLATNAEGEAMASSTLASTPASVAAEIPKVALQGAVDTGDVTAMFAQHYQIIPAIGTATAVHAAVTLTAGSQNISTAITASDYPRTTTIKGNAEGIAGDVMVYGTNIDDEEISETIALDGTTEVEGAVAFKTRGLIIFPQKTNASGDTVSIGVGNKVGLPHIAYNASCLLLALFDGSADSGGSLAVDADEIEKNLYTPAGTFDGEKVLDLIYLV
jgi:hypothetical protein